MFYFLFCQKWETLHHFLYKLLLCKFIYLQTVYKFKKACLNLYKFKNGYHNLPSAKQSNMDQCLNSCLISLNAYFSQRAVKFVLAAILTCLIVVGSAVNIALHDHFESRMISICLIFYAISHFIVYSILINDFLCNCYFKQ